MAKIENVITPKFHFESQAVAPSTPPVGTVAIYFKTDKKMYAKDDAGTEVLLSNQDTSEFARLLKGATPPTAGVEYRGTYFLVEGGDGVADAIKICVKKSDDTYDWVELGLT